MRRWSIALTAVVLAVVSAVVLPPLINANRLRGRLAAGLSAELGRPVTMDSVRVRLLPRPGFEIDNLVVAEDPAFGAEPVLRAANVTAAVRLLPLWRARIEVATISMREVSLNINRDAEKKWNFESILERTAQLPATARGARPTGTAGAKRSAGSGPQFPYLEVTEGRVNFKRGVEKLPLSFTNADFALWLETPNEWRLRFRAEPVRTDLNAPYTGEVRVEGSVRRADPPGAGLVASGVNLTGEWRDAPLGQLSRLVSGNDPGWRGDTTLEFGVKGTVGEAEVTTDLRLAGLRRDDFVPAAPLNLEVQCAAHVSVPGRTVDNAACKMPAGGGQVAVYGSAGYALGRLQISSQMQVAHVGAEWALDALRVVRRGVSPSLTAAGELNGQAGYSTGNAVAGGSEGENSVRPVNGLSGTLAWDKGSLSAAALGEPLVLPVVSVEAGAQGAEVGDGAAKSSRKGKVAKAAPLLVTSGMPVTLLPVKLALGEAQPLIVRGGFSAKGYSLECDGAAELARLTSLLRLLGLARWEVLREVKGRAVVHVGLSDVWMRESVGPPRSEGTVALSDVTAQTAWLPQAVTVKSAELVMGKGSMRWQNVEAEWAGTKFGGSAEKIDSCEEGECGWRVTAHTAALDLAAVRHAYSESDSQRLLGMFRGSAPVGWPEIHMNLIADVLSAGPLVVHHFDGAVVVGGGAAHIARLDGQVLGGQMQGTGDVKMSTGTTVLSLGVSGVSLDEAGAIFHERWGSGTAEASVGLTLRGLAAQNVSGEFTAMVRNGGLAAAVAAGTPLGKFDSWQMAGSVGDGRVTVERSVLGKDGLGKGAAGRGLLTSTATGSVTFERTMDWTVTPWVESASAATKAEKLSVRGALGEPLPGLQAAR
jgi:hypothetical protein